ncbi:MAG: tetratricopeptide repeat protein [Anaerolineae bacterium]|nr:tetratricopeptide repeat protein [Anaerolineae bacterium]
MRRGIQRSQHFGDPKAFADLSLQLGIFLRALAIYVEAEQRLQESLDGYVTLGERHNQGKAQNRLAFLQRLRGQLVDAERFANQALAILGANDDERALSYAILGTIAYDQLDWSAAAARYTQALTIYEENDNSNMAARVLADLAIVQGKLGEYEKATATFEQALALLDGLNLPVQAAVTRMNMGALYLEISQPAQALILYNRAEPVLRAVYDLRRVAYILSNQGIAYRDLDQLELSIQTLEEAIPYAQQTANYDLLVNTYDELGLSYRKSGREACAQTAFHQALIWLEQIESLPVRGHYGKIIADHVRTEL